MCRFHTHAPPSLLSRDTAGDPRRTSSMPLYGHRHGERGSARRACARSEPHYRFATGSLSPAPNRPERPPLVVPRTHEVRPTAITRAPAASTRGGEDRWPRSSRSGLSRDFASLEARPRSSARKPRTAAYRDSASEALRVGAPSTNPLARIPARTTERRRSLHGFTSPPRHHRSLGLITSFAVGALVLSLWRGVAFLWRAFMQEAAVWRGHRVRPSPGWSWPSRAVFLGTLLVAGLVNLVIVSFAITGPRHDACSAAFRWGRGGDRAKLLLVARLTPVPQDALCGPRGCSHASRAGARDAGVSAGRGGGYSR